MNHIFVIKTKVINFFVIKVLIKLILIKKNCMFNKKWLKFFLILLFKE